MSEYQPWEQSNRQAKKIIRHPAYQNVVQQLLYNCRAKTSPDSTTITPPTDEEGIRSKEFTPVFDDWLIDPDEDSEYESLRIDVLPEGYEDETGYETLAEIELMQCLADDLEFVKEYSLRFSEGRYWVFKRNYIFDPSAIYVKGDDRNFWHFDNLAIAGLEDIEELDEAIDTAV